MLELRRDLSVEDVEGRTLVGRALSYDRPYRVSDDGGQNYYDEGWRAGAVAQSMAAARNVFELRALHRDVRVGLVSFEDSTSDLRFRATIDGSEDGDALLAEVEANGLPGVSLGFRPRSQRPEHGVLWRLRAVVRELSVTDAAQYPDASVFALRGLHTAASAANELAAPTRATKARLDRLEASVRRGDAVLGYPRR